MIGVRSLLIVGLMHGLSVTSLLRDCYGGYLTWIGVFSMDLRSISLSLSKASSCSWW